MACNASTFDRDCDGCRHCCGTHTLDTDSTGTLHHDPQADADAGVWRRHALRSRLIRDRASN